MASGGFEHVPVLEVANLHSELKTFKDFGFWVYGLESEAEKKISDEKFSRKAVLVIGSEEGGLHKPIVSICDALLKIPQGQDFPSYNASVAAALVSYEYHRQHS